LRYAYMFFDFLGQISIAMKGLITIDRERCKGCSLCIEFCPKETIALSDSLNAKGYFTVEFKDNDRCTGCAICAVMCPEVAIEVFKA
jgi:2-oxoglutarate ferredoxin oxidoreductase subunit delta